MNLRFHKSGKVTVKRMFLVAYHWLKTFLSILFPIYNVGNCSKSVNIESMKFSVKKNQNKLLYITKGLTLSHDLKGKVIHVTGHKGS
jgi:hypothetical protein